MTLSSEAWAEVGPSGTHHRWDADTVRAHTTLAQLRDAIRGVAPCTNGSGACPCTQARDSGPLHCPTPAHNDATPSVNTQHKGGVALWHCHGCDAGGSIIDLHTVQGLTVAQAIQAAGHATGVPTQGHETARAPRSRRESATPASTPPNAPQGAETPAFTDPSNPTDVELVAHFSDLTDGGVIRAAHIRRPVTRTPPAPHPAILQREDGEPVVYAQRFSSIYGPPGCGKTWVALLTALAAITQAGRVLWWDHEDRPSTLAERAEMLGGLGAVTDTDALWFMDGELHDHSTHVFPEIAAWLQQAPDPTYSLVVIDSAESAGCPSDGADVYPWMQHNIDVWRKRDIAVLLLDHIPKNKDRARGAIGSQHKRAHIDGAALLAYSDQPCWTRKDEGHVRLIVEKDRIGNMPAPVNHQIAEINGTPTQALGPDSPGHIEVTINPPPAPRTGG